MKNAFTLAIALTVLQTIAGPGDSLFVQRLIGTSRVDVIKSRGYLMCGIALASEASLKHTAPVRSLDSMPIYAGLLPQRLSVRVTPFASSKRRHWRNFSPRQRSIWFRGASRGPSSVSHHLMSASGPSSSMTVRGFWSERG
jgi:hypothetical protein